MESREHAEQLIEYFERVVCEQDFEVWQKGSSTAKEWLRLIDSNDVSPDELSSFLGVIHANRHRTSGWYDLALGVYSWVRLKDYTVPPPEKFFSPSTLRYIQDMHETPSSEQAHTLLSIFQQYNREDPNSEVWGPGIRSTQEWLRLIEAKEVKKSEVSKLIETVVANQRRYLSIE